jgi:hypothetical protein
MSRVGAVGEQEGGDLPGVHHLPGLQQVPHHGQGRVAVAVGEEGVGGTGGHQQAH